MHMSACATRRLSHVFVPAVEYPVLTVLLVSSGYGFVDFDSPAAAQKAVAALKTTGVQAQMAKVRIHYSLNPDIAHTRVTQ